MARQAAGRARSASTARHTSVTADRTKALAVKGRERSLQCLKRVHRGGELATPAHLLRYRIRSQIEIVSINSPLATIDAGVPQPPQTDRVQAGDVLLPLLDTRARVRIARRCPRGRLVIGAHEPRAKLSKAAGQLREIKVVRGDQLGPVGQNIRNSRQLTIGDRTTNLLWDHAHGRAPDWRAARSWNADRAGPPRPGSPDRPRSCRDHRTPSWSARCRPGGGGRPAMPSAPARRSDGPPQGREPSSSCGAVWTDEGIRLSSAMTCTTYPGGSSTGSRWSAANANETERTCWVQPSADATRTRCTAGDAGARLGPVGGA